MLAAVFAVVLLPWVLVNAVYRTHSDKPEAAAVRETGISTNANSIEDNSAETIKVAVIDDHGIQYEEELDEYLIGVLLCEMPMSFDIEALKAQAVVSRTYVLRLQGFGTKHDGAVCKSPGCCQGYCDPETYLTGGGTTESVEKARKAVEETEGLVLTYGGNLIDATYFSCSGGMTEAALAVWGSDIPYLQATKSPGEEAAAHYMDTQAFSVSDFLSLLHLEQNRYLTISNITYTAGGGVDTIDINGVTFNGTQVRSMLSLRSTAFLITAVGETVTVTTKGFGHRVGMSQYGAEAMAKQGSTYTQILAHYYSGTELRSFEGQ